MKALNVLRTVERFAVVAIFLAMVALYFVNVAVRELASAYASNFAWVEEAVRLLNLFMVFLALGLALEYGRHVGVHTWRDRIAARTGLPLKRLIDFVGFVFSLYLVWLGVRMALFVLSTGQRSPTLNIPIGWIYLAPAIGFGLLALRYLLSLFGRIDRFSVQTGEE
ncbi:MAG: TRAP transporter small permease [Brucellaceae bacterium]|nr:TRAP transporter small permease [Brucellaceae bacterium]MCO5056785.1 TRAP transporter small permease [Rhizobiaceae bacterium]